MSTKETQAVEMTLESCRASGQPLPADAIEDYSRDPDCTHFYCPNCDDLLELPPASDGLIPQHMPGLGDDQELAEPTFHDLLDDQGGLIRALASIQLKGKQKEHLGQLFASADGEEARRDPSNRVKSVTRHSCSLIGGHLTRYFGGIGATDQMMWIGYIEHDAHDVERWVMRPQIRSALIQLGWFGPGPALPSATAPANGSAAQQSPQGTAELTDEQALLAAVQKSLRDDPAARAARLKVAPNVPEKYQRNTTAFRRNPDVIAQVLIRAAGHCEACLTPAPFRRATDGTPYLEVHHKVALADEGFDTVDNAVAVCPNCHRQAHYGRADPLGASGGSLQQELGDTY